MSRSHFTKNFRPMLETLNDRIVPATLVDLTTHGATGAANGALFSQYDATPNSGSINAFLRLDANGVEQAYNTDARHRLGDGNRDVVSSHAIRLGQIPLTTIGGVEYRAFFLDVRENRQQPMISLDELRIYVSQNQNLTNYNANTKTLGGESAVFDMDANEDNFVRLNADLNRRTGRGDAFVYIPNSVFAEQPGFGVGELVLTVRRQ